MVLATRRGYRDRKTPSGGIWNRHSSERAAWGALLFLIQAGHGWMLTLVYRAGRPIVGCRPQGRPPHSPGFRLPIREAEPY